MTSVHGTFILLLLCLLNTSNGFRHSSCSGRTRHQFQLPYCYLPPIDTSLTLSDVSFLMSHDAATGYINRGSISPGGLTWRYSKNQVGSVYQQLDDGARALDLRPKLQANNTIVFQHGSITIPISFETVVADAVQWCSDNEDELVLLLPSNFAYQQSASDSTHNDDGYDQDADPTIVSAMAAIYKSYGIPYYHCTEVYGMSIAEILNVAALPTGGYLIALDGQDHYGTPCAKPNWVEDQLVTCYPTYQNTTVSCTSNNAAPLDSLKNYMLASANNEPTDSKYVLGPPANLYNYPLNEIQAFWQVSAASAVTGLSRLSSILDDNKKSDLNRELVDMVHEGQFDSISIFAVDNVALHGNALLSVLRTACGQSSDIEECGEALARPTMSYFGLSKLAFALLVSAYVLLLLWICAAIFISLRDGVNEPHPRILWTVCYRLKDQLFQNDSAQEGLSELPTNSREEELLPSSDS